MTQSTIQPGSVSLQRRRRRFRAATCRNQSLVAAKGPSTCSTPPPCWALMWLVENQSADLFYGPSAGYQKPPVCSRLERLSGNKRLRLQQQSLWRGGKRSLRPSRTRVHVSF